MADYAEIVKALRLCSAVNSSCEECPCNDPADDLCECANKVGIAAADAIENLRTENAALRRMIGNLTDEKAALVKELHDSKSEKLYAYGMNKALGFGTERVACVMQEAVGNYQQFREWADSGDYYGYELLARKMGQIMHSPCNVDTAGADTPVFGDTLD